MNESIITGLTGWNGKYFNNMQRTFEPLERYSKGSEQYKTDKKQLADLYNGNMPLVSLSDFQNFDINYSVHDSVFASQFNEWQALSNTIKAQDKTNRHLISFDFETIGVRNARAFDINTGALTEFGFTDTVIKNGQPGKSKSYSVAFGISEEQGTSFLKDIALFNEGLEGFAKSEAGSIESTVERLTRYSGNITDLFDAVNIGRLKDVTVINKLSPSSVANVDKALWCRGAGGWQRYPSCYQTPSWRPDTSRRSYPK